MRAYKESNDERYLDAATARLRQLSSTRSTKEASPSPTPSGDLWFEEYIVSPPTHILNGFIWALWGVHDYFLATHDACGRRISSLVASARCCTISTATTWDSGRSTSNPARACPWSPAASIINCTSCSYASCTASPEKRNSPAVADRWESYTRSRANRTRALCYKIAFKLCYY